MMSALEIIPQTFFQLDAQHEHKRIEEPKVPPYLAGGDVPRSKPALSVGVPPTHTPLPGASQWLHLRAQPRCLLIFQFRSYGQGFLGLRTFSTFKKVEGMSHPTCHRDTSVIFKIRQLCFLPLPAPVHLSHDTALSLMLYITEYETQKHKQYFRVCFFKNDICIKSLKMKRQ